MSILTKFKFSDAKDFIDMCSAHIEFDTESMYNEVKKWREIAQRKPPSIPGISAMKLLEDRWYSSLESGTPDYSVYADPYYICDIWACWSIYSRTSILDLAKSNSMVDKSVIEYFGELNTVIDLGCGFGYTTAALKEIYPGATVVGTNLPGTYQYEIVTKIGNEYGFTVQSESHGLGKDGLVFASEYFEHFENPIEHLEEVLTNTDPKFMVIVNAFNTRACGHFLEYSHHGVKYPGKKISKMFSNKLRECGYQKVKTKIWNDRPAVWERK